MIQTSASIEEKRAIKQQFKPVFKFFVGRDSTKNYSGATYLQGTVQILKAYASSLIEKCSFVESRTLDNMKARIDAVIAETAAIISEMPNRSNNLSNTSQQVAVQVTQQEQQQQQQVLARQSMTGLTPLKEKPAYNLTTFDFDDDDSLPLPPISEDFRWKPEALFTETQKSFYKKIENLLIIQEGERKRVYALSIDEAKRCYDAIQHSNVKDNLRVAIITDDTDLVINGIGAHQIENDLLDSEWLKDILIDVALFNGRIKDRDRLKAKIEKNLGGYKAFWHQVYTRQTDGSQVCDIVGVTSILAEIEGAHKFTTDRGTFTVAAANEATNADPAVNTVEKTKNYFTGLTVAKRDAKERESKKGESNFGFWKRINMFYDRHSAMKWVGFFTCGLSHLLVCTYFGFAQLFAIALKKREDQQGKS